jgi:hypothetical protein
VGVKRITARATRALVVVAALSRVLAPSGVAAAPARSLAAVDSVRIPASLDLTSLFVRRGEVFASGTMTLDNDQGVACVDARVTSSLAFADVVEPRCDDPTLEDESVIPITSAIDDQGDGEVRLAFRTAPSGPIRVGPVLMKFQFNSGSHLEWTYGPGVLWMFEEQTANGPEVFRVSEATGAVLQVTKVPDLLRPLISANADGLYLAPGPISESNYGGTIEYVGIGARHPQAVGHEPAPGGYSSWIIAEGTSVWSDECTRPAASSCTIWRFAGPDLQPVFHVADSGRTGTWVSGSAAMGFYTSVRSNSSLGTSAPSTEPWTIVHIDPETGATSDVASLTLPTFTTIPAIRAPEPRS